jgi:hypothetical protein
MPSTGIQGIRLKDMFRSSFVHLQVGGMSPDLPTLREDG